MKRLTKKQRKQVKNRRQLRNKRSICYLMDQERKKNDKQTNESR